MIWERTRILLTCGFIGLILFALPMASCIGIFDLLLVVPFQERSLDKINIANASDPPDIDVLVNALWSPDWLVVAVASGDLGELQEHRKISPEDSQIILTTLSRRLGREGNWWRFGWDEDEAYYGGFLGSSVDTIASFGVQAFPTLTQMLEDGNSQQQEAACWAIYTMIRKEIAAIGEIDADLLASVGQVQQSSSDTGVQRSCQLDEEMH